MQFGYALLGETWTSVIMIGVVGELLTGNKKPLIYRGVFSYIGQECRLTNKIKI